MNLILVANPGSASRKYALFDDTSLTRQAELHFEHENERIVCAVSTPDETHQIETDLVDFSDASARVMPILKERGIVTDDAHITTIGLRVVAPQSYFLEDHVIDETVIEKLHAVRHLAPLHIDATLHELEVLTSNYPDIPVVGVSDSAFHAKKPNYTWNYGIDIADADRLEIKRYGYHGISVAGVVKNLWDHGRLASKLIVCHLGSGSSVTAVYHGRSIDNSMGYSPNEGMIMATRSGSITPDAAHALQAGLSLDDQGLESYLNTRAGLLGLSGSSDVRTLLERETAGEHQAHLALTTLVHTIHKQIGAMIVAMNGCDMLVFTGTIGERSAVLRKRIVAHLEFMDFVLDGEKNSATTYPEKPVVISQVAKSRQILVMPTDEAKEIATRAKKLASAA